MVRGGCLSMCENTWPCLEYVQKLRVVVVVVVVVGLVLLLLLLDVVEDDVDLIPVQGEDLRGGLEVVRPVAHESLDVFRLALGRAVEPLLDS